MFAARLGHHGSPTNSERATRSADHAEVMPGLHLVASLLKRWIAGTLHYGSQRPAALLPRRVHLPVQPPHLQKPRNALLPTPPAGRRHRPTSPRHPAHQLKPLTSPAALKQIPRTQYDAIIQAQRLWWNRRWGRLTRRDVLIFYGPKVWTGKHEGGPEGRSKRVTAASEAEALEISRGFASSVATIEGTHRSGRCIRGQSTSPMPSRRAYDRRQWYRSRAWRSVARSASSAQC